MPGTAARTGDTTRIPDKVKHAEPLYFDLVRDLGARKGEREWNIGADFMNTGHYKEYALLAEYEFAPVNRLGLEAETDFSFFKSTGNDHELPERGLTSLRLSAQYSFFVSPEYKTTLAAGYTQVFDFGKGRYSRKPALKKMKYNPFFIAAKRWGNNIHTLIYTYPVIGQEWPERAVDVTWQVNTSFHYAVPHTGYFIGIEVNNEIDRGRCLMILRPEAKIKLNNRLAVGFVTGLPVYTDKEGISSFFRIIYEP